MSETKVLFRELIGVTEEAVSVRVRIRVNVREGGKNGERKDCIEGKEGWEGWGKGRITEQIRQHCPM